MKIEPSEKKITIRENKFGEVILEGLNEKKLENLNQLRNLLFDSYQYKHISSTCMNNESSRCHTIATIEILVKIYKILE